MIGLQRYIQGKSLFTLSLPRLTIYCYHCHIEMNQLYSNTRTREITKERRLEEQSRKKEEKIRGEETRVRARVGRDLSLED